MIDGICDYTEMERVKAWKKISFSETLLCRNTHRNNKICTLQYIRNAAINFNNLIPKVVSN